MESDNLTRRSALSSRSAEGSKSFKTSFFGFNKNSVIEYIDNLCRDAAEQERRLEAIVDEMTRRSNRLEQDITGYENKISEYRSEAAFEKAKAATTTEENARLVNVHKDEKERLENEVASGRAENIKLVSRCNAFDLQMQQLKRELAEESEKGTRLQSRLTSVYNELNETKQQLFTRETELRAQGEENSRLKMQIASLQERISMLDAQREEVVNAIVEARRTATMIIDGAKSNAEMERSKIFGNVEQFTNKISELKSELSTMGGQIDSVVGSFTNAQQQQQQQQAAYQNAQAPYGAPQYGYYQQQPSAYMPLQQPAYQAVQQPSYAQSPYNYGTQQPTYTPPAPVRPEPQYAPPVQQEPHYGAPVQPEPQYAPPVQQEPRYSAPAQSEQQYAAPEPVHQPEPERVVRQPAIQVSGAQPKGEKSTDNLYDKLLNMLGNNY